ncbi:hypothetical protein B0H19DRAFT_1223959 [Mycena capillaripes]|nr:hypothetical protein B0H19DRAFT_1223959 [Mycena capillaripes]
MWENYRLNGAEFSAGDDPEDLEVRNRRLRGEAEIFGLWNPEATAKKLGFGNDGMGGLVEEDEDEDFLAEILRNADLQEPEPFEIQNPGENTTSATSGEWFPYPSKMMFLLDTLDNLPRLRISGSLMHVFLWILKEAGCKNVPSFDHLRRVQKELLGQCSIPSIPCKSPQGNVFFMNDPRVIIAQDWANPATRKLIQLYPEIPHDGVIREIWHAQKWRKNMDLDILSPMYAACATHYYVNEVACLRNGKFVVPIRWVIFRDKVWADAFLVTSNEQGEATIADQKTILICVDDLRHNYHDLDAMGKIPKWGASTIEAGYPARMPNPKRIIAAGRPFYSSFVDYFSDDVSGNKSKSWNKHWNAYMTHRNLPRQILQQEFHIHFISTSPNASVSEQFSEFKHAVEETHIDPIAVEDESGNAACISIYVNAGPSDNPMQSEISAHIGGKGNCLCRKCRVGGTQKDKATDKGYHALFEAGIPRTKEFILQELRKQVKLACSGVIKPVKDLQTETGVKDVYTQFYIDQLLSRFKEMKKDPTRTVDEIESELTRWTVDNKDTIYSPFLTVKGEWGLSVHAIRANYIMQYAGSLIGRQFKTIVQTNLFHVRDLVTEDQFKAWRACGELAALLWIPEIRNLAEYRQDLKVAVANVLDIFGTIDPSKIVSKIKLHLLVHTDEDVVEFGPLVGVITEGFESFNTVFRHCSVLSNRLAPSRDIARQLADQEGLKHRLTGGWWCSAENEKWLHAGDIKRVSLKRGQRERVTYSLHATTAARAINYGLYTAESVWTKCEWVAGESLEECFVGSWVFAKSATAQDSTIPGRITDILVDSNGTVLVVLEVFQVLSSRDEIYGVPVLVRRDSEEIFSILPAKNVKFKFNVQHDCELAQCDFSGVRLRMQERVESDQIENFVVHKPLDRFFIYSQAFHNAHLLRATLPRDLIAPIPLFPNRQQKPYDLAEQLREMQKAAAEKRKRSEEDDGEDEGRLKKKKKTAKGKAAKVVSGESMVASRGRRQITKTKKALATPPEREDSTTDSADDSGIEEVVETSDSDYHSE